MSIRDEIKGRVWRLTRARKLVRLPRLYVGDRRVRCMLLTQNVAQAVTGPSGWLPEDERFAQFRGNLDAFATGEAVTIAKHPFFKPTDADLAPLHPVSSHVWDFRVLEPPHGIRCLGCFVAKDVFVALTWEYREGIEVADWSDLIEECHRSWDDLFSPFAPHSGDFPDAYLSQPFRTV